jgi:hypothetical protein
VLPGRRKDRGEMAALCSAWGQRVDFKLYNHEEELMTVCSELRIGEDPLA